MDQKMKVILGIYFLFHVTAAQEGRIIGGSAATNGQFPYQVAMFRNHQAWCGGSILDNEHIVTAAHCTEGVDPRTLTVRVGTYDTSRNIGVDHQVISFVNHPNYIGEGIFDFDVSVLRLGSSISYGATVKPIKMAGPGDKVAGGTMGIVSGFGAINANMVSTPTLKHVRVPLWTYEQCQKFGITPRMLCAGDLDGQASSCQGDSGGPLVVNNILFGIVSHGPGCGRAGPAVYTSVPVVRDWIINVMNKM